MARGSLHHVELRVPGWTLLFPDRHPQAGGPGTYAGCLANADGFEVELVAGVDGGNLLDMPCAAPVG